MMLRSRRATTPFENGSPDRSHVRRRRCRTPHPSDEAQARKRDGSCSNIEILSPEALIASLNEKYGPKNTSSIPQKFSTVQSAERSDPPNNEGINRSAPNNKVKDNRSIFDSRRRAIFLEVAPSPLDPVVVKSVKPETMKLRERIPKVTDAPVVARNTAPKAPQQQSSMRANTEKHDELNRNEKKEHNSNDNKYEEKQRNGGKGNDRIIPHWYIDFVPGTSQKVMKRVMDGFRHVNVVKSYRQQESSSNGSSHIVCKNGRRKKSVCTQTRPQKISCTSTQTDSQDFTDIGPQTPYWTLSNGVQDEVANAPAHGPGTMRHNRGRRLLNDTAEQVKRVRIDGTGSAKRTAAFPDLIWRAFKLEQRRHQSSTLLQCRSSTLSEKARDPRREADAFVNVIHEKYVKKNDAPASQETFSRKHTEEAVPSDSKGDEDLDCSLSWLIKFKSGTPPQTMKNVTKILHYVHNVEFYQPLRKMSSVCSNQLMGNERFRMPPECSTKSAQTEPPQFPESSSQTESRQILSTSTQTDLCQLSNVAVQTGLRQRLNAEARTVDENMRKSTPPSQKRVKEEPESSPACASSGGNPEFGMLAESLMISPVNDTGVQSKPGGEKRRICSTNNKTKRVRMDDSHLPDNVSNSSGVLQSVPSTVLTEPGTAPDNSNFGLQRVLVPESAYGAGQICGPSLEQYSLFSRHTPQNMTEQMQKDAPTSALSQGIPNISGQCDASLQSGTFMLRENQPMVYSPQVFYGSRTTTPTYVIDPALNEMLQQQRVGYNYSNIPRMGLYNAGQSAVGNLLEGNDTVILNPNRPRIFARHQVRAPPQQISQMMHNFPGYMPPFPNTANNTNQRP